MRVTVTVEIDDEYDITDEDTTRALHADTDTVEAFEAAVMEQLRDAATSALCDGEGKVHHTVEVCEYLKVRNAAWRTAQTEYAAQDV
jgi:hypothetical protein